MSALVFLSKVLAWLLKVSCLPNLGLALQCFISCILKCSYGKRFLRQSLNTRCIQTKDILYSHLFWRLCHCGTKGWVHILCCVCWHVSCWASEDWLVTSGVQALTRRRVLRMSWLFCSSRCIMYMDYVLVGNSYSALCKCTLITHSWICIIKNTCGIWINSFSDYAVSDVSVLNFGNILIWKWSWFRVSEILDAPGRMV